MYRNRVEGGMARIMETIDGQAIERLERRSGSGGADLSERHFRRLPDRFEAAGADGSDDWRRGRSSDRAPKTLKRWRSRSTLPFPK